MTRNHLLKLHLNHYTSLAVITLMALMQQAFFNPIFPAGPIIPEATAAYSNQPAQVAEQPNIKPFALNNWSAPVVISSKEKVFMQQDLSVGTDNYINWGMVNDGQSIEIPFTNCLYFDGVLVHCWDVQQLGQGEFFIIEDWQMPNEAQSGSHFVQILMDVNNNVEESIENDNQWAFDFTWLPNDSITQSYVNATPLNDALIQPDYPGIPTQDVNFSSAPDYYNTSSFMSGSVAVGIVFPESAGNGENWTATEEQQVVAEIQDGLNHWSSWGGASADLSFTYEIKYKVPTNYEPISKPMNQHCPWISEVMTNIGFPEAGGPCLSQSRGYINDLRIRKGTDWAFVIFVVDSSQDADGKFPDGYFSYAYVGGPYVVTTYDNASLGITGMDRIISHETGHIFHAGDNYYIAGYGGCESTSEKYGYLGIPNSNCQKNNPGANLYTLMGQYYDKLYSPHSTTKLQVGWRDSDGDTLYDPTDTNPQVNITNQPPDTSTNTQLTYSGTAYDQPYPHAVCPFFYNCGNTDITINKIISIQYRVDGGTWVNVPAIDGAFNSDWEGFTFTTPSLVSGTHSIDIITTNSVGTVINPYWTDAVTVQTVPQPPGSFNKISPTGRVLGTNSVALSWNTSFGATSYSYCYDTTNDDACGNWISTGNQTSVMINGLTQETTYYWQARASNIFGVTYADNNTFWMFNSGTPLSNVRLVIPNGLTSGTCDSWYIACDLNYALTQAVSSNEIWVAKGTYTPGTLQTDTFLLKNGVAIYGGFAGVEISRSQRDPAKYVTILSGDLVHNDLPNYANKDDNSYHVVTGSDTDNTAILDGFTISGGYANSSFPHNFGGGMYNYNGSPTLKNLIFSGNVARMGGGGGMYNENSNPIMTNIVFDGNLAELASSWGGWGGGMYNAMSSPSIKNITFSRNQARSLGDGSGGWGGAVYNYQSSPTIVNATVYGNQASSGGGIFNNQSHPILTNDTFSENSAIVTPGWSGGAGGGIYNSNSNPEIRNTIFWGNTASDGTQFYNDSNSIPLISYSILESGCPEGATCQNNVVGDPLLGEIYNYNGFAITIPVDVNSPAVDAGNDATCATTDQRGITRPEGTHCDIGAYEFKIITLPTSWVGGISVSSDKNIVTVGRPHIGNEIASYDGFSTAGAHTAYVPMLFRSAFGGTYNAAFYIQNVHTSSMAHITIKYYDSTGALTCSTSDTISPLASKGYWLPSTCVPAGWVGGVVITSDQPVVAIGRPHIGAEVMTYNSFSTGSLTSYIPMLFRAAYGGTYNAAFYVQNVGAATADLTIKYYDSTGALTCTATDTLSALASKGYWLPGTCVPANWVGGAVVTSTQPIVSVGRPHIGTQITTYNGFSAGSGTSYVPMLFRGAFGGTYNAAFYVQNLSGSAANVTIKYYDLAGALTCTATDTLSALASKGYWLPGTCVPANWVGGAVITSNQDIVTVGRPHIGAQVTTYDGFTSGSLASYLPMLFKAAYGGTYNAAYYIQNTEATAATVITKFYDSTGALTCSRSDTLAPFSTLSLWAPSLTCTP